MKVVIRKDAKKVYKTIYEQGKRRKVPLHLIADAFNSYNESMRLAGLLYQAFSKEYAMARNQALSNLEKRLTKLGVTRMIDWTEAFRNAYDSRTS